MTATVYQGRYRPASIGDSAEGTIDYFTMGEPDETTAHAAAVAQCVSDFPSGYRSMPLRSTSIEEMAPSVFKCPMKFALPQDQAKPSTIPHPEDPAHADNAFKPSRGFQCIGGTRHITTSLVTTQSVSIFGHTTVDFKKLINVEYSADGKDATARGLDLLAGAPELTWTAQQPNSVMTAAYQRVISEMTDPCHVNDDTFYGYERGELLFKGCTGQQHGMDLWQLTFVFLFSKNVTGFVVSPDLPAIDKKGWQYAWLLNELGSPTVNGRETLRPVQCNVETVYPFGDFRKLLIGVG